MPDLVSHAASAYIFRNVLPKLRTSRKPYFLMVVFGTFLPDVVARGVLKLLPDAFLVLQFFHTPVALFFQTALISCCFAKQQRYGVFKAITVGWILHQTYDLIQITLGPGYYYVFWPLSNLPVSFDLVLPKYWPYIAVITLAVAFMTEKKTLFWLNNSLLVHIRVKDKVAEAREKEAEQESY